MSIVIETTLGDITVDLFLKERPKATFNFLKLCKMNYYNYSLFHTIESGFIAQTGDPTGSRKGGECIFGVINGPQQRYIEAEKIPKMKHTTMGLLSFVGNDDGMIGSQFFITLGDDLRYLDENHCIFAEVMEGLDVLEQLNETICDGDKRPYKDVRITHTVILDDPFPDPPGICIPERSPSPSAERLRGGQIAADEDITDTAEKTAEEMTELLANKEAKSRATILEMVGDIPDAEVAPPENVLFVCKLNPVTTEDDLEIIFSRFGRIASCEIIKDKNTGDSLQYAFVEFENPRSCVDAYFRMNNVLIDDRRIHVDFSQSVARVKWLGKGRGVAKFDEYGHKSTDSQNDLGKGNYKLASSWRRKDKRHDDRDEKKRRDSTERESRSNLKRRVSFWDDDQPQRQERSSPCNYPRRTNDRSFRSGERQRNGNRDTERNSYKSRSQESRTEHRSRSPRQGGSSGLKRLSSSTNSKKEVHRSKSKEKREPSWSSDEEKQRERSKKSKKKKSKKRKKDKKKKSSDNSSD